MTQAHHLLTDGEIQKIREREQKATNGPWEIGEPPSIYSEPPIYVVTTAKGIEGHALFMAYNWESKGDDAAFITHARQDIPRLLADREELRRTIEDQEIEIVKLKEALNAIRSPPEP